MLLKNEIRGVIESVGDVIQGKKDAYQEIIVRVKAPVDGAGVAYGEDELFPIMIFGAETIRSTWSALAEAGKGTRVKCRVYLNSRARELEDGRTFYNYSMNLKSMEGIG